MAEGAVLVGKALFGGVGNRAGYRSPVPGSTPVPESTPTVAIKIPSTAPIPVLIGSLPIITAIDEKAKTISAKNSAGPNITATLASSGPNSVRLIIAMVAPTKELTAERPSAGLARPSLANG